MTQDEYNEFVTNHESCGMQLICVTAVEDDNVFPIDPDNPPVGIMTFVSSEAGEA